VDDVAVALEHVDLLNGLDGLYVELFQRSLELLVVGAGALVDLLDLPARGSLASVYPISDLSFISDVSIVYPSLRFAGGCGDSRFRKQYSVRGCQNGGESAYPVCTY
jgi:hypothetical protein